ncbi:MAG: hypothetical protein K0R36_1054 [Chryseobacterium sp.]|jgi:hypothetical protein|uniref:hypothetical protein n=1 Tax=Chryseobacterium sp. TaxID=1871047 RepID=UPI002620730D|nr:hypothetical protein [Chryseobacterium sp.]MDF2551219.1 hypothetical protein [Chryseobacterium sp.]MDF2931723.1 hypothetical protein [Chryseobacterium sp.]
MLNEILKNAKKLKSADLKGIVGGVSGTPDLSLCGCSCSGAVTGPKYCPTYIGCLQVYTCDDFAV